MKGTIELSDHERRVISKAMRFDASTAELATIANRGLSRKFDSRFRLTKLACRSYFAALSPPANGENDGR